MEGRGLTNLLLAIIAGVLLFGKGAMVSGLQGLFFVAVAIAVIWGVLSLALYLFRETTKALRDAKDWKELGLVLFGIGFCCVGIPMLTYSGWLWLDGVPHPMNAAIDSGIGKAWMVVLIMLAVGAGFAALQDGWRWAVDNRNELPSIIGRSLRIASRGYIEFLGGPFTFPIREWRFRTEAGAGITTKLISAAYVTVIGLLVSLMTIILTGGAVVGLMAAMGILA